MSATGRRPQNMKTPSKRLLSAAGLVVLSMCFTGSTSGQQGSVEARRIAMKPPSSSKKPYKPKFTPEEIAKNRLELKDRYRERLEKGFCDAPSNSGFNKGDRPEDYDNPQKKPVNEATPKGAPQLDKKPIWDARFHKMRSDQGRTPDCQRHSLAKKMVDIIARKTMADWSSVNPIDVSVDKFVEALHNMRPDKRGEGAFASYWDAETMERLGHDPVGTVKDATLW
jgi:hypothetical protein